MTAHYEVFKLDNDGVAMWVSTAKSFSGAEELARKLASNSPGRYMIFDRVARSKTVMELQAPMQ